MRVSSSPLPESRRQSPRPSRALSTLSCFIPLLLLQPSVAFHQLTPKFSPTQQRRMTHYNPIREISRDRTARSVIQQQSSTDSKIHGPPAGGEDIDPLAAKKMAAMKERKKKIPRSSPVFVSDATEALSHSETTMKLIPSYDLFQILPEDEGGVRSESEIRYYEQLQREGGRGVVEDTLADFVIDENVEPVHLPDPFKLVENELKPFSDSISELVSTDQPILSMAAKHFFEKRHGKRFRPTIVQLVAKMCASAEAEVTSGSKHDWESSGASDMSSLSGGVVTSDNHKGSDIWRKQGQLGQVTEMIHVASLIHDDVLDEADTRRGGEAVHKLYSNKVAVLAGDYLLARASVLLARLENTAVVQIMATALESLVAGEIMQLKSPPQSLLEMESYLRKSYYKTASLICYACRSTALLGGHNYGSTVATACEEFGFHLGLAYQIKDDILDYTGVASILGKPALADMQLGLSTAPILYAASEFSELKPLIMRRFKKEGDRDRALELLFQSNHAMNRASDLANFHANKAIECLKRLPQSVSRDALMRLTWIVVTRKK